jgi:hypothetical protein
MTRDELVKDLLQVTNLLFAERIADALDKALDNILGRGKQEHIRARCRAAFSRGEPTTRRENVVRGVSPNAKNARKTRCKRGHPLFGTNLFKDGRGRRRCRACIKMRNDGRRDPQARAAFAKSLGGTDE